MTAPKRTNPPPSEPSQENARSAAQGEALRSEPGPAGAAVSPEEQMARFEEDLKESDWGHQPC